MYTLAIIETNAYLCYKAFTALNKSLGRQN